MRRCPVPIFLLINNLSYWHSDSSQQPVPAPGPLSPGVSCTGHYPWCPLWASWVLPRFVPSPCSVFSGKGPRRETGGTRWTRDELYANASQQGCANLSSGWRAQGSCLHTLASLLYRHFILSVLMCVPVSVRGRALLSAWHRMYTYPMTV